MSKLPQHIEELFDKKFEGYWRGWSIPDEIKSFIATILEERNNKILLALLELVAVTDINNVYKIVDRIINLIKEDDHTTNNK